ncbi:hypothetical protein IHE44_0013672 [Lamprotornis superbus]|uniref:Uncharacterized protein n=1 Tax=Lamprotornis superbus TaxID=245042 RepID=A0A835P102_9PASS|nr:hypothetical protein IHE44_0013672 [Lamprotornis superbus]
MSMNIYELMKGVSILSRHTVPPHAGTEHLNVCLQMGSIVTKLACGVLAVFSMKSQGTKGTNFVHKLPFKDFYFLCAVIKYDPNERTATHQTTANTRALTVHKKLRLVENTSGQVPQYLWQISKASPRQIGPKEGGGTLVFQSVRFIGSNIESEKQKALQSSLKHFHLPAIEGIENLVEEEVDISTSPTKALSHHGLSQAAHKELSDRKKRAKEHAGSWKHTSKYPHATRRLRAICSISAKMKVLEILITSAKFHRVTLFYTSGIRIKRNDTDPRFMSMASRYNSTVHERPNCHQVILSTCHYVFPIGAPTHTQQSSKSTQAETEQLGQGQPKPGRSWKQGFDTTIITTGISVSSKF